MKRILVFASIAIAMLYQLSCSLDEEQTQSENPITNDSTSVLNAPRFVGNVVLENMYADEAGKLTSKTPLEIITVLEGTGKVSLQAQFRAVKDGPFGSPVYECELIDDSAEVARGMSGSPVGPPGRVMGALAFAYWYSKPPYRFLVTPIDYMETAINHPTFGEFLNGEAAPAAPAMAMNALYAPVKTPVIMTGIQPHRIQELSLHLSNSKFDFVELLGDIGGAPAAPPAGTTTKLFAGDMIGAAVATGDVTSLIGYGTVTQVYDDKFVAFGHPFFADGKSALPVYRAVTHGIRSSLAAPTKSVSAYGNPIGTITKDLHPAIVGKLGPGPAMIPVKVSYHPVNNTPIEKHHVVAYGQEWAISYVTAVTMDAIRMERNAATVEGTVTLHFQETETVYTEKFRTASSNPFFDVFIKTGSIINAFTDTLTNSAGKATLKAVSIAIVDKPQIATAEIDEIIVPAEVMPGESLTVSVVLLPHWSTAGAKRIMQRDVILDIPDGFPIGEANLTVSAADESTDDTEFTQLFGDIFDDILGDDEEDDDEKPLPRNLDELIRQKEEDQMDAGLITITLTPSAFGGGFLLPEDLPLPESGEEGEGDDGAIPEGFPFPEGLPLPEGFPLPDNSAEQPIETELVIEGFIVTGSKEARITIKVGDVGAGVLPIEGGE
ncbi:MAG: hypothetical protein OXH00_20570 [Candidatus Poribacteria bacterium]|nr:hypothetical protein [Candidatus Poribacteria bacterium]